MNQLTKIPSKQQAHELLTEAERINPGNWVQHSHVAARAAEAIAAHHPDLQPDSAYVLGLLHDIGRRDSHSMRHVLTGYRFLQRLGYDDAARIALTHAFPIKDVYSIFGEWNCPTEEVQFVQEYLDQVEYNDYDRLIQLCDVLSLSTGFCLIEKRLVDVAIRRGINDRVASRMRAYLDLKNYFDEKIVRNVYSILPGVVENTFGFSS